MSYYPPSGSSYPYSAYHPPQANAYHSSHVQSAGGYPTTAYQQAYPATTVQGYGATWPYYSYYAPQQQQAQVTSRSTPRQAAATSTTQTTQTGTGTSATTASTTTTSAQHAIALPAPTTSVIAPSGTQLRNLMYGFGDDRNPANDSVNVMEEILIEYIVDVCQTAVGPGKKARLSVEDIRRALSRPADAKKLARMEELLFMQEDIKRARSQFEESDMNQAAAFQG
ncbi:transcription initiation factor IID, 18kD subunit-domain-containing protein [Irpex rosettiformis]|uniref:Transcription initiation factor IID, 18kD subunit-domain-containing protein n=1 Tax=Irpex rosettiformis TaxID=378272 RepID=A0ACB8UHZ0_9APHY|nr:transcription initiation factor IID, 18kD subunit-domain-containing protein [Irpex rosettiformis]